MRHQIAFIVPLHLFGRAPTDTLNVATFHLAEIDARVDRVSNVVQYVRAEERMAPCQHIHHHLTHCHAERIIIEWLAETLFLVPPDVRCLVETGGAQTYLTKVH